ncbi:MAG: polyprenyl synthetase family protein [Pseudomonadota bacterium]
MNPRFEALVVQQRQWINEHIPIKLRSYGEPSETNGASCDELVDATHYALEGSAKRIRPLLVVLSARAVQADIPDQSLVDAACAVEMIHTYSLVHDDLPAMDDDDRRRGRPTVHKAFDEATAILVGDGLQALAFKTIAKSQSLDAEQRIAMTDLLAEAAGLGGMVGGQFVDVRSTNEGLTLEELQSMHLLKTGALIRAAVGLGAIAAAADSHQRAALDRYSLHVGLAFQIVDDILDVEKSSEQLGKTSGKDERANKATYVSLLGLSEAKAAAQSHLERALDALTGFGESANGLRDLALYIVTRDR